MATTKKTAAKKTDHVEELRKAVSALRKNGVGVKVSVVTTDDNGVTTTEVL